MQPKTLTLFAGLCLPVLAVGWALAQPPAQPGPPPGPPPGAPRGDGALVQIFQQADADHNGQVTLDEFNAALPKIAPLLFKRLDRNGDGVISSADRPQPRPGMPPGPAGQPPAGTPPPPPVPPDRGCIWQADRDNDGKITWEEVQAHCPHISREVFNRLDRNQDGVLTAADRPARGAHKGGGKQGKRGPGRPPAQAPMLPAPPAATAPAAPQTP